MTPDSVNACFEGGSAGLLLLNVVRLYRDKKLAGVSIIPTAWFSLWGAWNLHYYKAIQQPLSWDAGAAVFVINTVWVLMALWYRKKKGRSSIAEKE